MASRLKHQIAVCTAEPHLPNTIPKHEQQFPEFQREQVQPTKDHLLPKSQNGILSKRNKVFACESCNAMKGNLLPDQFLMVMESMVIATKHSHQREISRLKRIMTNVRQICNQRLPGSTNGNR